MTGNPRALALEQPLQIDEARRAMQTVASQRREARLHFERMLVAAAEAEREYRKDRAQCYARVDKPTAGERDAWVDGESADTRYKRDLARGMIKAAEERIAEIDGDRASLHRLADWSLRLDPFATDDRQSVRSAA